MSNATLIGTGLGPGDASLLTLRAADELGRARTVAYIHAAGGKAIAREIAATFLPQDINEIAIAVDMRAGTAERRAAYDKGIGEIKKYLAAGEDVCFLCEGDPLFYGSFIHVAEKIKDDFAVSSIPAVSSINAAAADAMTGLASDDDVFCVIPGTLDEPQLAARLSQPGPAAIIKVGRNLEKIKRALRIKGREQSALLVTSAGGENSRVEKLADATNAPYFSLVLVSAVAKTALPTPENVAIVAPNAASLQTGLLLKQRIPGARLYARADAAGVDEVFSATGEILRELFFAGRPILAIVASGIVIRELAGRLNDKTVEPPVVSLSPDGSHVVPLLGGHRGANRLARAVAQATGGAAAITTAGEGLAGVALDDPPAGWRVENPGAYRAVAARMLAGDKVIIEKQCGDVRWLDAGGEFLVPGSASPDEASVLITAEQVESPGQMLVLHPPVLALGVGCERGTDPDELYDLAMRALAQKNLSPAAVASVCSLDLKSDEAAVLQLAERLGVAARFFSAAELERETPRLANPSETVFAEVGCHGVSEAAALAAVGRDGELLVEKQKSRRATAALALAANGIDAGSVGRGRGRLYIVGTGPGREGWRTPEAAAALRRVSDVVGYGLYLDLVADLVAGKNLHTSNLSEEEARVRKALELAAGGREVALVSSGDPGIYAMAALAFELLDRENRDDWNRIAIETVPGISAFQAASARIGAPMGHDFCLISLSDLLTPWEVIEGRVRAAAAGGFVVAFYNPVSKRRTHQLELARDILLTERDPETPVVLARNLGRDGERVETTTLGLLKSTDADMLTMVIVGGPGTRMVRRGERTYVYTPRGYAKKMQ